SDQDHLENVGLSEFVANFGWSELLVVEFPFQHEESPRRLQDSTERDHSPRFRKHCCRMRVLVSDLIRHTLTATGMKAKEEDRCRST
ncbi:MAG: hypothetical protein LC749_11015, partial [Actinobacteria bacterium]|nr:hypothetical protein [Actinomycetota bacterium]